MCQVEDWVICQGCSEQNPTVAKFCMHCGKNLAKVRDNRLWDGEIMRIASDADTTLLEKALRTAFGKLPNDREKITVAEIIEILPKLTQKQEQVMIRAFNLDNKGVRNKYQIAEEMGSSIRAVRDRLDWLLGSVFDDLEAEYLKAKKILEPLADR